MLPGWLNLSRKPLKWRLDTLYDGVDDPVLKSDMSQVEAAAIDLFREASANRAPAFEQLEAATITFQKLRAFTLLRPKNVQNRIEESLIDAVSDRLDKASLRLQAVEHLASQSEGAPVGWSELVARLRPVVGTPHEIYNDLKEQRHLERAAESSRMNSVDRMRQAAERHGGEAAVAAQLKSRKRAVREDARDAFEDILKAGRSTAAFALSQSSAIPERRDQARRNADASEGVLRLAAEIARRRGPQLAKRYAAFKSRKLRLDAFAWYDAPAPTRRISGRKSWKTAVSDTLAGIAALHPDLAYDVRLLIASGAVDARPGGAAFTYPLLQPAAPKTRFMGPFVRAPFDGSRSSQMTLAHELGHAAHQLAARKVSRCLGDPGFALAETAALASELAVMQDDLHLLIDRDFAMLCRQPALAAFEARILRFRDAELSAQDYDALWLQAISAHYGDAVALDGYDSHWARVASFVRQPGYPAAYHLGWSLAGHIVETIAATGRPAQDTYLHLLEAGGRTDFDAAIRRTGAMGVETLIHQAYDRAEARLDKADPRNGGRQRSRAK